MRVILLALAALAASESLAEACSCMSSGPPCQATWQADAVFAARVLSIGPVVAGDRPFDSSRRRVRMRVTEAFRNVAVGEVDVFTGSGGGDCGYNFVVGSDYLIYAYRHPKDGRLGTGICSRTRPIGDAADDLRYLRGPAREAATGRGRLFGIVQRRDPAADGMSVTWVPVPGLPVTATGDRTYRARTAADGSFEMAVLAGKYQVTVDLPDELYVHGPAPAEVRDLRGCAEVILVPQWNGRVGGRVLNAAGDPVPGFAVELVPVSAPSGVGFSADQRSRTDGEGRYEIARVRPGVYHLGSDTWRSGPRGPQRQQGPAGLRLLLTDETTSPRVMEVGRGNRVEAADFVLPEQVKLSQVGGLVLGTNGAPATGVQVYVRLDADDISDLPSPAVTAKDGRFSVTVIAGRRYRVSAEGYEKGRYASHAEVRGIDAGDAVKGLVLELMPVKSGGS